MPLPESRNAEFRIAASRGIRRASLDQLGVAAATRDCRNVSDLQHVRSVVAPLDGVGGKMPPVSDFTDGIGDFSEIEICLQSLAARDNGCAPNPDHVHLPRPTRRCANVVGRIKELGKMAEKRPYGGTQIYAPQKNYTYLAAASFAASRDNRRTPCSMDSGADIAIETVR